jgi:hypothetical protein
MLKCRSVCVSGGLFGENDEHPNVENAFRYAVYRINHDRQILPDTRLLYDIQHVPTEDGFRASKKGTALCSDENFLFIGSREPCAVIAGPHKIM